MSVKNIFKKISIDIETAEKFRNLLGYKICKAVSSESVTVKELDEIIDCASDVVKHLTEGKDGLTDTENVYHHGNVSELLKRVRELGEEIQTDADTFDYKKSLTLVKVAQLEESAKIVIEYLNDIRKEVNDAKN